MPYTLGLDLGPNSIGWAIVDEAGQKVIRCGVRVFPEGVDRDKQGGEISKNENRRIKRGMRRQIARRARRKRLLRECLKAAGMLPEDPAARLALEAQDPWALRARGLDKRLELHEIGRVILHLNQRRGFLSNRKTDKPDNEKSQMLAEISALQRQMEASRCRTLGEYLYREQAKAGEARLVRIRGKHTRRAMLVEEFNRLWAAQASHYPAVMTEELRRTIGDPKEGILFHQRALHGAEKLVGECELERGKRRCARAVRAAQKFRLYQEINHLRVCENDVEWAFTDPDRKALREQLIAYLSRYEKRDFEQIKKELGLLDGASFNLNKGERKNMQGLVTDARLAKKELFGKGWWERPEAQRDEIARSLLLDDEETVREKGVREWGLDAEAASRVAAFNDFPKGYMEYSLAAIEKLLPFVERGLPLTAEEGQPCALTSAGYLLPYQRQVTVEALLPEPPELTNPLVRQALYQVRQVVNAIVREYGKPERIHIELAREVKGSAERRAEETKRMREREAKRDAAAEELRQAGVPVNRAAIDRYMLWEEQGRHCIYTGKVISLVELFGGEVDEDHILPYSRSLDNSLANRVVCRREANAEKGAQTPWEWLGEREPERYERVLQQARQLPYNKRHKFLLKNVELNAFINRQLVDTAYITRAVAQYVRHLGADVVGTKGQLTAELRQLWGLNTVLRDDGLNLKNREDHRHHAVDALVVALTSRQRLQALARSRFNPAMEIPIPWEGFRQAVETAVNAIYVSHRVERRVSGALHEETLYGPTVKRWRAGEAKERPWAAGWIEEAGATVYRKPVEQLTPAMVEDIRDPVVRKLVEERLKAHGIEPGAGKAIPAAVWKEPLRMPGERGPVIRRVRLIKRDETIQPIRGGRAMVKPGSNHHVAIFEYSEKGKVKREAVFVSMLEATRRLKAHEPIIQSEHPTRPEAKFVMSLSRGEMVLGTFKGQERLVCFRTGASTQGQLYFISHTDARPSAAMEKFAVKANTLQARKVTVNPLGDLRWAND